MNTPSTLELIYVAIIGVAWPLYDHFIDWPIFLRRVGEGRRYARFFEYAVTMAKEWLLVAAGITLWHQAARPWSGLAIQPPSGWRLVSSIVCLALLGVGYASQAAKVTRSATARAKIRKAMGSLEAILPHSSAEYTWFLLTSVTAGICEELLFRGYVIWALSPWLSWWGAAIVSAIAFGFVHSYQGVKGIIRTGVVGAIMTLIVAVTHSLFPAIVLHALIDIGSGTIAWLAFREHASAADEVGNPPAGSDNQGGTVASV